MGRSWLLLAGSLQQVAGRARDNVARNGAFYVNAHGQSLRLSFADGSKNVSPLCMTNSKVLLAFLAADFISGSATF